MGGSEPCCLPDSSCQLFPPGQCAADGGTVVSHCPTNGRCVPPGDDCFTTQCGRTLFDFCNDPIPADFFAPGSEPFSGIIILGGPMDGLPDTTVRRFDAMLLDFPPGPPETIPIELVQLSLVSCSPITVRIGTMDTLWNVAVDLSPPPNPPLPPGGMTVTKQHPNGGVFTAQFHVLPRFTFAEVVPPTGDQVILDFGAPPERPPTLFETTDTPKWVHELPPGFPHSPCGVYFVPGVEENPPGSLQMCCTETCHANPGGGHDHCTKQCNICPTGACCNPANNTCSIANGPGMCAGQYKGDGTNCDDTDGDGLADWFENNACCQPSSACNISSSPRDADSDNDGISDGAEVSQDCDPCLPFDCGPVPCCLPSGVCQSLPLQQCTDVGGSPVANCVDGERCIPRGEDCFATPCGNTAVDFCETPIPADFFAPGSDPFDGIVVLRGAAFPQPDTFMERLGAAAPDVGESDTVPIRLRELDLVSCDPIVVNINGDTLWNVEVTLSRTAVPNGSMTITRAHLEGGTFRSEFSVQPLFIFKPAGAVIPSNCCSIHPSPGCDSAACTASVCGVDPYCCNVAWDGVCVGEAVNLCGGLCPGVRVLDTAATGQPPDFLQAVGTSPWVYDSQGEIQPQCGQNFVPGAQLSSGQRTHICCVPVCHAGATASHCIVVGQACTPCPHEACCNTADGSCTLLLPGECNEEPMGIGTTCQDFDADGIADVSETGICCNPDRNMCRTGTDPNDPDTDNDGLLDGFELKKTKCDPCVPDSVDTDGDGIPDDCGEQHYVKFSQPPKSAPCACNADFDQNGIIDVSDFQCLLDCISGSCACCGTKTCDVNCDGVVNSPGDTDAFQCRFVGNPPDVCCPAGSEPGEDYPSDIDWSDMIPNNVAADDFVSDGRPITAVRWWGSNIDKLPCPKPAPAGQDCWDTQCGGSQYSFAATPIPAGFFNSGSDAFTGEILMQGADGSDTPDTFIDREADMCFDGPLPVIASTPIRIADLDLVGCGPITVTYNGGQNPELWTVTVFLDGPQPTGNLTATKTNDNGGTFDTFLPVRPGFEFRRVSDGLTRIFTPGVVQALTSAGTQWTQSPPPYGTCGPVGFHPGSSMGQCCVEACHSVPGSHDHCVRPPQCPPCPGPAIDPDQGGQTAEARPARPLEPAAITGATALRPAPQPEPIPTIRSARVTWEKMLAFNEKIPAAGRQAAPFQEGPGPVEIGAGGEGRPGESLPTPEGGVLRAPPLGTSFQGLLDNNTFIPPDTMGAVGPNHIAEMLNSEFVVFDRGGGVVNGPISHQAFWAGLGLPTVFGTGQFAFDPKILYDQHNDRWVATACHGAGISPSYVLVGVSDGNIPHGTWNLYAILADPSGTVWADYPGLGVDATNVVVTHNMFFVGGGFSHAETRVISKASAKGGGPLSIATFMDGKGAFTWQPCHSFDLEPAGHNYIVSQNWTTPPAQRFIRIQEIAGIGAAAALTDLGFIEVAGYNTGILNAPQSGCSIDVETNDTRLLNAVLRKGMIWTTHHVGNPAGKTEVSWYQLDPTTASVPGPYVMPLQQGRVVDPTRFYYFPSIAVNKEECVALGFSGSDAATFVSAYYTARFPTDPAGTMQPVNLLKAGEAGYVQLDSIGRNRWGDYSATVVDPRDWHTFWTVQEYAETPFNPGAVCTGDSKGARWGTWWGSFQCENNIDGWLISFHEPLAKEDPQAEPLALYFCDIKVVDIEYTNLPDCQGHQVYKYEVNLDRCCLVHANVDSRTGNFPALKNGFYEEKGLAYNIDIQAVVGHKYHQDKDTGLCIEKVTGKGAAHHFWGWHTTVNENGQVNALRASVKMGPGGAWLYGPWFDLNPKCSDPNMAFELLTNTPMLICKEKCCQCPPGPHWIDGCVEGQDRLKSGAHVGIDLTLDCVVDTTLTLDGPAFISKIGPLDDSQRYPGTRPVDGHLDVMDTEMVLMRLTGAGGVVLTAGVKHGLDPSYGVIAENPANSLVGQTFFDVFFRADLGGGLVAYNHKAHRVTSDIFCVPPNEPYQNAPVCLPLYDRPRGDPSAVHIANLVTTIHYPMTECGPNRPCPDDGQFCNGPESCDLTTFTCVSGPPPVCPPPDVECVNAVCDPSANGGMGACVLVNKADGTPCVSFGEGNPQCDNPDTCLNGICQENRKPAGTPCTKDPNPGDPDCDNPDTCDGAGNCNFNREPDGTACTDDGNQCTNDVCQAGKCAHPNKPDGTACNDGLFCTQTDACLNGMCAGSGNPCPPGTVCDEATDMCVPENQACCLPDEMSFDCMNMLPADCMAMGGSPQGVGSVCTSPAPCCTPDGRCHMVDPLCCDELGGTVTPGPTCVLYGDITPKPFGDGFVDVGDVLKMLDGFSDASLCPQCDIAPCCGDDFIDVGDVLAILDAFAGNPPCPDTTCPCGGP